MATIRIAADSTPASHEDTPAPAPTGENDLQRYLSGTLPEREFQTKMGIDPDKQAPHMIDAHPALVACLLKAQGVVPESLKNAYRVGTLDINFTAVRDNSDPAQAGLPVLVEIQDPTNDYMPADLREVLGIKSQVRIEVMRLALPDESPDKAAITSTQVGQTVRDDGTIMSRYTYFLPEHGPLYTMYEKNDTFDEAWKSQPPEISRVPESGVPERLKKIRDEAKKCPTLF